jgi:hypothetical protein
MSSNYTRSTFVQTYYGASLRRTNLVGFNQGEKMQTLKRVLKKLSPHEQIPGQKYIANQQVEEGAFVLHAVARSLGFHSLAECCIFCIFLNEKNM